MAKEIFVPALDEINKSQIPILKPRSFQNYLSENGLTGGNTAQYISIDAYELLAPELRENNTMVFRLGTSHDGKGTQFTLVQIKDKLKDFFLIDQEVLNKSERQIFLPKAGMHDLYAYHLFPELTETSLVNLALSSGLLSHALKLDRKDPILAPATGRSTFSFKFRPHSDLSEVLVHNRGQVEIDALFIGERNGVTSLFVLEAKSNKQIKSLAKHKLVYPVLAVAPNVPKEIPIIPVYMKVSKTVQGLHYHILECKFPDPRGDIPALNELVPFAHSNYVLPSFKS